MSINKALKVLLNKKLVLTLGVLLGVVVAMLGIFLTDLEYKTSESFIVIQEQRFADSFTQAKSAEYLGGILSQIVDTDSFRELVLAKNPKIAGILPRTNTELRKEWSRTVKAKALQDSGILKVEVFNKDARASRLILDAVGDVLTEKSAKYLGETSSIKLVKIDGPVTSEFPVRPNFALNSLAGALVGGIVFSSVLLLKASQKKESSRDFSRNRGVKDANYPRLRESKHSFNGREKSGFSKKSHQQDLGELIKATRALSTKL